MITFVIIYMLFRVGERIKGCLIQACIEVIGFIRIRGIVCRGNYLVITGTPVIEGSIRDIHAK